MDFAERLKAIRQKKGMKQRELAQKLRTTNTSVSNWEHGVSRPTSSVFFLLAEALDVNPLELLGDFTNKDIQVLEWIPAEKRTYEEGMALGYLKQVADEIGSGLAAAIPEKLFQGGGDQVLYAYQMLNPRGKGLLIDYLVSLLRVPDYVDEAEAVGGEHDEIADLLKVRDIIGKETGHGEHSEKR